MFTESRTFRLNVAFVLGVGYIPCLSLARREDVSCALNEIYRAPDSWGDCHPSGKSFEMTSYGGRRAENTCN
jgi:hypothetical protein